MRQASDLTTPMDLLSGAEVERQTGIRQATLRMWETRYGFPQPLRDQRDARVYPVEQVERLQAVKRLIDRGLRSGKIFSGGASMHTAGLRRTAKVPAEYLTCIGLLRGYRQAELHKLFQRRLMEIGLYRFVIEFLGPLTTAVGAAWSEGELPIRCEHLYTQIVKSILHAKQAVVRTASDGRPKIVLATPAGEQHALGIMMAEATMASLGASCIQLGSDIPVLEVAAAAVETDADIVALSFSSFFPRRALVRTLAPLRARLPGTAAIWVGGAGATASKSLVQGVEVVGTLDAIEPALRDWRAQWTVRQAGVRDLVPD